MPVEINASLEQQGKLGPARQFEIVNGKEIRIVVGNKSKQQTYSVHLLALADKGALRLNIAWRWIFVFAVCLLVLTAYYIATSAFGLTFSGYGFSIVGGVGLTAVLAIVLFLLNLTRKRVYFSRYAKVQLFDILISNPDYRSYKAFIDTLSACQQKARSFWQLKPEHQIAGEMRMLRRLVAQGIVSQKVYDQAKDSLFSISNKKSS